MDPVERQARAALVMSMVFGMSEAAETLGWPENRLCQRIGREARNPDQRKRTPPVPQPIFRLKQGPLFFIEEYRKYAIDNPDLCPSPNLNVSARWTTRNE